VQCLGAGHTRVSAAVFEAILLLFLLGHQKHGRLSGRRTGNVKASGPNPVFSPGLLSASKGCEEG